MRATDIAKLLAQHVDRVVLELLPHGKRIGHEWRVGSVDGEQGKSLGVHLSGEKAGVWLDGESGQAGDLIGLWMAVRKLTLSEACREALQFLGVREDRIEAPRKSYAKPSRDGVSSLSDAHAAWLRDERKLPDESVTAYRLASRGEWIMFPYLVAAELVFAKYRKPPKVFRADPDCEPILFGWQAISPQARAVVICEGELDAIAWHAYGFPALSMPTGAGSCAWLESEHERLKSFDKIFLSCDMDAAGQKSVAMFCERFGRERTHVVRLPAKDANQCLIDGITRDEIIAVMRDAKTLDPSELRTAFELEDDVVAEFTRIDDGLPPPWKKAEGLKFRQGEVSIWAGINGHGKSEVVGHVAAFQAVHGTRCCIASMEFAAARWLKRLYRQIAATAHPTEQYIRHISGQLRDSLWVFDIAGTAKADRILEVFSYAKRRYGIELFVIDNLAKCGFAEDDYNGQKTFVDRLTDFARTSGAHVMLVAHMRKGEDENSPSGKMSIKGTGALADMCDTIIEVWRNKPREQAKRTAREESMRHGTPYALPEKFASQADTLLLCHKQRNGESEPRIGLYFDLESHQFVEHESHRARQMIEFFGAPVDRSVVAA